MRGTSHEDFPGREIGLWIGAGEPRTWRDDVDLCVALICDGASDASASVAVDFSCAVPRIAFRLPLLVPLEQHIPPELARFHKYLRPEPFRPLLVLAAVHELATLIGGDEAGEGNGEMTSKGEKGTISAAHAEGPNRHLRAFLDVTTAFLLRELLAGEVEIGLKQPIRQRGAELLNALFVISCRRRFPAYRTLLRGGKWQELICIYCSALKSPRLGASEREGAREIRLPKAEIMRDSIRSGEHGSSR